jgi:hypothetical protein
VDWDKEASKLALPTNEYVRAIKAMKLPELVEEFAKTAPAPVGKTVPDMNEHTRPSPSIGHPHPRNLAI